MAKAEKEEEKKDEAPVEGAEGGGEGGEGAKGGNKKLFIIIGAVVVLLLGGGAGAYFMGFLDGVLGVKKEEACVEEKDEHGEVTKPCPHEEGGEHAEGEGEDGHGEEAAADDGHGAPADDGHGGKDGAKDSSKFLEIPPITVNLTGEDGAQNYLRLTVQLEMKKVSDKAAVEAVMPRVIDQFQTYLRELRVQDLRGSAGIYRLQMELLWRVNQAAAPVEVKDVLFQEILVQ